MDALHKKAYLYALVLTFYELRNFKRFVKNKATGTSQRGVLCTIVGSWHYACPVSVLVRHTQCGAFSVARFGKPGNAKAYRTWNE